MTSLHRILLGILSLSALGFAFAADNDIPQRQRLTPTAVRVVSANIRFIVPDDDGTGNEWTNRKELARDVLLAQDADIICFQEFRKAHHDFLKSYFPDYEDAGFVDGDDGQKANMVYYSKKRFAKIAHDGAFLSPTPEVYLSRFPDSPKSARHVNRVILKDRLTGRELMVWNTHLSAGGKRQPARDNQAGVVAAFLKKQPADIPQIVTGDFNCPAKTAAVQSIKSAGFTDTYAALHGPEDPGYTYHNFLGLDYGKKNGKIDFIFCNDNLRPTVTEIIRDHRGNRYPSDHYFLSTEFEYAKPAAAVVRVVSANIRYLAKADEGTVNEWDKRKEFARDVLRAQNADIICFQEFNKEHGDYLEAQFPDYAAFGLVERDDGRKLNTVYYSQKRFEKIAGGGAFLSDTPDVYRSKFEESSQVRHVTCVHLKDRATGRELMIWNTHFDHRSNPARAKQAVALIDLIKKQPSSIGHVITGDLNCDAKTQAIKTIKAGGFTDTYTALHGPDDPGYTYHGFQGTSYTGKAHGKIDFVFCNDVLRPTAAKIIRDSRDGRYPSDHYFVSAELEFAKP